MRIRPIARNDLYGLQALAQQDSDAAHLPDRFSRSQYIRRAGASVVRGACTERGR